MNWLPWRKRKVDASIERLRAMLKSSGGNMVITVTDGGDLCCAWFGLTDQQAAESLYTAADEVVRALIPVKSHVLH